MGSLGDIVNGWEIRQQGFEFSRFKNKWIAFRKGTEADEYLHDNGTVHDACCTEGGMWRGYFDTREEAVAAAENYKGESCAEDNE